MEKLLSAIRKWSMMVIFCFKLKIIVFLDNKIALSVESPEYVVPVSKTLTKETSYKWIQVSVVPVAKKARRSKHIF